MKPLKLIYAQLNSSLQNNLCKTHNAWRCAPGSSTKKALDNSRALAQKRRNAIKTIDQLVTRIHWQLHRQRLPHFGHPHSSSHAAQR